MGDTRLFFHPEAMKVGKRGRIKHSVRMGTLIGNVNHVTAHIPASKISIQQSHLINRPGCAKTLPVNMRKNKFIASTEGSIFLDKYTMDYARCRGGFTNPKAKYPRGLLNFLDQEGCDDAPAR